MSDSNQRNAGTEVPDAEVELSAEDLLGLSAPCVSNERPSAATPQPVVVSVPSAPARRRSSTSRTVVSFVLAVGALGAVYFAKIPSNHAEQDARLPQSQLPVTALKSEDKPAGGNPVRFTNPFDAREVFEFPAGTSEAEARDAVAALLMERAMERQRKFDARVSSNR